MQNVLLVIHLLLAIGLVGVILIQRSEGGGLGMGGSQGGFMTTRGAANLLTRTTAILATAFITTSLILAILAAHGRKPAPSSVLDRPVPTAPAAPAQPQVPLAR